MTELKVISKKYNDKDELIVENFEEELSKNVKESLKGKDIEVNGITSKGIANTGGLANIGDVAISGDLIVQGENKGNISASGKITGSEIVENMSGYSFINPSSTGTTFENIYAGVVKTGNKITFVISLDITKSAETTDYAPLLGRFVVPSDIADKLYPSNVGGYNFLDNRALQVFSSGGDYVNKPGYITKSTTQLSFVLTGINVLVNGTKYHVRYECTFLLSENLASE